MARRDMLGRVEALESKRYPKGTLIQALDAAEAIARVHIRLEEARARGVARRALRGLERELHDTAERFALSEWESAIGRQLDAADAEARNPSILSHGARGW